MYVHKYLHACMCAEENARWALGIYLIIHASASAEIFPKNFKALHLRVTILTSSRCGHFLLHATHFALPQRECWVYAQLHHFLYCSGRIHIDSCPACHHSGAWQGLFDFSNACGIPNPKPFHSLIACRALSRPASLSQFQRICLDMSRERCMETCHVVTLPLLIPSSS